MLTQTRKVLHRHITMSSRATFVARDDDTGLVTASLNLSEADFKDMGEPDTITLTVEPGDRLNP